MPFAANYSVRKSANIKMSPPKLKMPSANLGITLANGGHPMRQLRTRLKICKTLHKGPIPNINNRGNIAYIRIRVLSRKERNLGRQLPPRGRSRETTLWRRRNCSPNTPRMSGKRQDSCLSEGKERPKPAKAIHNCLAKPYAKDRALSRKKRNRCLRLDLSTSL